MTIETNSAAETFALAKKMAAQSKSGDIYCLVGDLGAGKTVFAKGFASGLLIHEPVTSPTFTLMNVYTGRLMLYHFDLYRIEACEEIDELGFEEFFNGEGCCLIEWPMIAKASIPKSATWITLERDLYKEDTRTITITEGTGLHMDMGEKNDIIN